MCSFNENEYFIVRFLSFHLGVLFGFLRFYKNSCLLTSSMRCCECCCGCCCTGPCCDWHRWDIWSNEVRFWKWESFRSHRPAASIVASFVHCRSDWSSFDKFEWFDWYLRKSIGCVLKVAGSKSMWSSYSYSMPVPTSSLYSSASSDDGRDRFRFFALFNVKVVTLVGRFNCS